MCHYVGVLEVLFVGFHGSKELIFKGGKDLTRLFIFLQ
jgi:hypothetical protein